MRKSRIWWSGVAIVLALYCVTMADASAYYLVTVTRAQGYTGDTTYVQLIGPRESTAEVALSNPKVGSTNARIYSYTFQLKDVGTVCTVKLRISGYDGWKVGQVYIGDIKNLKLLQFSFEQEIDDKATLTRTISRNGNWGAWGEWGNCEAECGRNGLVTRQRLCNNPEPFCGGSMCSGSSNETQPCKSAPCPTLPTNTDAFTTPIDSASKTASNSAVISLGIVLALSVLLSIILAIFLIVVLRDKREDKKLEKSNFVNIGNSAEGSDHAFTNRSVFAD